MVLGVHVVLCMTTNFFTTKMGKIGQAQGSLNVLESIQLFLLVSYFFISVVYNESLY